MFETSLKAYKFRKETGKLTLGNINHWVINNTDYVIRYFKSNDQLDIEINEDERGITVVNGNMRVIYIRDTLAKQDKISTLVHEVGHAVLDSKNPLSPHSEKEKNANKFAKKVLKKNDVGYLVYLGFCKNIFLCLILAVLLAFCTTQMYFLKQENKQLKSKDKNSVYVTKGGDKFHTENCGAIKDSVKLRIDIHEAKKAFSKCKLCNPE